MGYQKRVVPPLEEEKSIPSVLKQHRRDKRRERKVSSKDRINGCYCGATFHVSKRNQGRKPKRKR